MNKKAIVSISSKQIGNEEEAIEVVTPGDFYQKDDLYYAVYEETTISGMEGTTTTLKIGKNTLSLIRTGSTSAKMEFEEKKENISMYNTPYGTLELKIKTNNLNINIDNEGGDVFIDYHMSVSGQSPQNTLLNINIKTQDQN